MASAVAALPRRSQEGKMAASSRLDSTLAALFAALCTALAADSALAAARCPNGTRPEGAMCVYDRGPQGSALGCQQTVTRQRLMGLGAGMKPQYATVKLPAVQRGLTDCFEPPEDGYGWTTPGGILVGKICPAGTADTGVTCHYDRGPGKPFTYRACPAGYQERGVLCGRDPQRIGKWRVSGWNGDCNPDEQKRCDGMCGASMVSCSRQCPPGWRDDGTACWLDVDTKERAHDCDGGVQVGLLCYPPARPGFNCTVTACSFGKNVHPGRRIGGTGMSCRADQENIGGFCYPKPIPHFSCSSLTRCFAYLKDLPEKLNVPPPPKGQPPRPRPAQRSATANH
jgi:hypothetical protein